MNFIKVLKQEKIQGLLKPRGIQVSPKTPYSQVIDELQKKKRFCAVVLDGKKVVGIFTERDALGQGLLADMDPKTPISQLMTKDPAVIHAQDHIAKAIKLMDSGKYRHLPVVNDQEDFVGLISVRDIIFYLSENYPYEVLNQPPDVHQVSESAEGA